MSTYEIRPAKRSEAKPLIGLYAESGCGKTWSALMLARGFVGPSGRVVMIETEGGRGEAYADLLPGGYDVVSLRENFSPEEYGKALTVVEKAMPEALLIDSASHEWEGSGGVLSMAAGNQADGMKGVLVWQGPKLAHQRHFMLRLLATPIPLVIVCMRAKYPMVEAIKDGKKEWMRSEKLEPKQSEDILFELFAHGWIDREHRFQPTKYTRDDLRKVILPNEPISIATGERLAAWARGGAGAGDTRSVAQADRVQDRSASAPPPAPTDELPPDRNAMLGRISAAADKRKLSARQRADLWAKHCPGAGPDNVDVACLSDLYAAITKGAAAAYLEQAPR